MLQKLASWYRKQRNTLNGVPFTLEEATKTIKSKNNQVAAIGLWFLGYVLDDSASRSIHNDATVWFAIGSYTVVGLGFICFINHIMIDKKVKKMRQEYAANAARGFA